MGVAVAVIGGSQDLEADPEALGELSAADPGSLSDSELSAGVRACGRLRARVDATEAKYLAELLRRRGARSAGGLLRDGTHVSARAARSRLDAAGVLAELPSAADALGRGEITVEHAQHLARAAKAHPVDAGLVEAAKGEPADDFAKTVQAWVNDHDDDGGSGRAERQRARRKAEVFTRDDDGMVIVHAELDPESGAVVRHALAAESERLWRQEHGTKPTRAKATPRQRRADALVSMCSPHPKAGGDGPPPRAGRAPRPSMLVTVSYDALAGRLSGGRLSDGSPLTPDAARRLACDADILPMLLDTDGQPLEMGRDARLPSPGLRRAVIERDRTCICGCGTPPEWCQIHHIVHWSRFGLTDLDNLVLVCSNAHHLLHEGSWSVIKTRAGYGMHPP